MGAIRARANVYLAEIIVKDADVVQKVFEQVLLVEERPADRS